MYSAKVWGLEKSWIWTADRSFGSHSATFGAPKYIGTAPT